MQPRRIDGTGTGRTQTMASRKTRSDEFSKILENNQKNFVTSSAKVKIAGKKRGGWISLGVLSSKKPTVSNLLIENSTYGKECWKIVHGAQNSKKPFNRIKAGTEIFIDPASREIVWGKEFKAYSREVGPDSLARKALDKKSIPKPEGERAQGLGSELVEAVRPFMGKGYDEIDCYNLVVKGLGNMGVQYRGAGGLSEKLAAMARLKGLASNAYVNGEGLIKASGNDVYSRMLRPVKDVEKATANVMAEMEPLLEKGQILSFSMRRRGHTGIISRMEDRNWTYINSGTIDNSVDRGARVKGVGEEFLTEEVKNWIKLAANEGESLEISLGRFDKKSLASFEKGNRNFMEKT